MKTNQTIKASWDKKQSVKEFKMMTQMKYNSYKINRNLINSNKINSNKINSNKMNSNKINSDKINSNKMNSNKIQFNRIKTDQKKNVTQNEKASAGGFEPPTCSLGGCCHIH